MASEFDNLVKEIEAGTRVISLHSLTSTAAKANVLARLQKLTGRTFGVITESNSDAEAWQSDLKFFQSEISNFKSQIVLLPSFETDPYAGTSPHAETLERRAL